MKQSIPFAEQETTITMIRADHTANVYTCDPTVMNKMDRLCKEHPDQFKLDRYDSFSKWYIVDKSSIKFHAKKEYSDEQKAKLSQAAKERFSKINSKPADTK